MVKSIVTRLNTSNLLGLSGTHIDNTCDAINSFLFDFEKLPESETKGELLVLPCAKGENPAKWLKVIVRARKQPFEKDKINFALSIFLLSRNEFNECKTLQIN